MATKRKARSARSPRKSTRTKRGSSSAQRPGTSSKQPRGKKVSASIEFVPNTNPQAYTSLGYRAVDSARRDGRSPTGGSGDYHTRYDRGDLVNQSRAFYRDNGLYRGLIDRAVTNIVRRGFGLQMRSTSKHFNEFIEARWKADFASKPEARGMLSWWRIEQMIMRELIICGDIGAIKVGKGKKKGKLQLIESERVAKTKSNQGVDLDAEGAPLRYYVANYSARGRLQTSDASAFSLEEFLFLAILDRPSQTRGVPVCQASFSMLHRIMDVCDSEALAWQALSRLAFSVTNDAAGEDAFNTSGEDPDHDSEDLDEDLSRRLHELEYALIYHGKPGDKVEGINRNIPGSNFTESLRTFLRLMGLPLGLPLELVLLDWSQSNYSSARASLEQAFAVFEDYQTLLEEGLHKPTLLWKLESWTREYRKTFPRRKLPANAEKHEWIKPSFPWIDQLKEAEAWALKLDRGLTTHAKACKSLNSDRDELMAVREAEINDALERAARLEKKFGIKVPWQIFCGLEPPSASKKLPKPEDSEADGSGDLPPAPPPKPARRTRKG